MTIKCLNCHKEVKQHDGKRHRLYCNGACKKAYQRKAKLVDNGTESISGQRNTTITGQVFPDSYIGAVPLTEDTIARVPGQCWCCGTNIGPGLVCCGPCAWSGKAAAKRAGRYPPLLTDRTPKQMKADLLAPVLTGGYQLTATERANYKPADQLGKGEHNHVSKPGDADYEQHRHEGRA